MMKWWGYLLILVIPILIAIAFLGKPSNFEIDYKLYKFGWNDINKKDDTKNEETYSFKTEDRKIAIDKVWSGQEIYQPYDEAYVYFYVNNTLAVPYNISVYWIHNNTRHLGWSNVSTDFYDLSHEYDSWRSYFIINERGLWETHIVVKYRNNNQIFTTDKTTKFRVI